LVLFLTSLLATSPLVIIAVAVLARKHRLTILLHLRAFPAGDLHVAGLDDSEEEEEARMARGHRAPPPRAAAMAMSADDLMARFLSWRLITALALPEDETQASLQAWRLRIKFLRKLCWKAPALGPRIASVEEK